MKKTWKRVTICLSEQDYADLKLIASLRKESAAAFIRYLIEIHIKVNGALVPFIQMARDMQSIDSNTPIK